MLSRFKLIAIVCLAAAIETGTQTSTWRQCLTDATPAAIDACTAIILLDPQNDGSFVNRGIAYRRVGEVELALEDYEEAIHLNPDAADAFNNRGNALRAKEEFDLAIRDYTKPSASIRTTHMRSTIAASSSSTWATRAARSSISIARSQKISRTPMHFGIAGLRARTSRCSTAH